MEPVRLDAKLGNARDDLALNANAFSQDRQLIAAEPSLTPLHGSAKPENQHRAAPSRSTGNPAAGAKLMPQEDKPHALLCCRQAERDQFVSGLPAVAKDWP
jgi:hypothetical protein